MPISFAPLSTTTKQDLDAAIAEGAEGPGKYADARMKILGSATTSHYELVRAFASGADYGYERAMQEVRDLVPKLFPEEREAAATTSDTTDTSNTSATPATN